MNYDTALTSLRTALGERDEDIDTSPEFFDAVRTIVEDAPPRIGQAVWIISEFCDAAPVYAGKIREITAHKTAETPFIKIRAGATKYDLHGYWMRNVFPSEREALEALTHRNRTEGEKP